MNRRNALKNIGKGAVIGVSSIPVTSRIFTNTEKLNIGISYHKTINERVPHNFLNNLQEYVQTFLGDPLGLQVNITIKYSYVDIPITYYERDNNRRQIVRKWKQFDQQTPAADRQLQSNILILNDTRNQGSNTNVSGHAEIPLLPTCTHNKSYGIATIAANNYYNYLDMDLSDRAFHLITHEIGHTIGLTHAHGCNHPQKTGRSIMLNTSFAKKVSRNIFGDTISKQARRLNYLNPKICQNHTTIK